MEPIIEIVLLLAVFIFGLTLRIFPYWKFHLPGTSDMFFHFSKIRNPSHGEDEVIYPSLFHGLFRFFRRADGTLPEHSVSRLMPIFDIGTASILYIFLRGAFNSEIAILAVLIFLVTPATVIQGITFSPRPLGLMFLVSALLCLTLPFPYNYIAMIPVALTLLSHRLATQTLFFIMIGFSFFDWQIGIILGAGVGLALLLSRGRYLKILRSHINAIKGYIKGTRVPNRPLNGILLAPTAIGFVLYFGLVFLQVLFPFPIVIFGITIPGLHILIPYFELFTLVWGIICLFLLLVWILGESYRYTYFASVPFAILNALLFYNAIVFQVLVVILVSVSVLLSIYFAAKFQHLDESIVSLLQELGKIPDPVFFLTPYQLLRATIYFSEKRGTYVSFAETTPGEVRVRIEKEEITHIVTDRHHLSWFTDYKAVIEKGDWTLLSTSNQ